ncbi:MAG TPA: ATP-binding protein, partial [Patescibacteria group bacterium]|nr:ATP-binding protein [Patescibacteria group bacterium]
SIIDEDVLRLQALLEIQSTASEIEAQTLSFRLIGNETAQAQGSAAAEKKDELLANMEKLNSWEAQYRSHLDITSEGSTDFLARVQEAQSHVASSAIQLIGLKEQRAASDVVSAEEARLSGAQQHLKDVVTKAVSVELNILDQKHDQATQEVARTQRTNQYLVLGSLILAVLIGYIITRRISSPLIRLKNAVKEIAGGNLNKKVELTSKDEIGQLAATFNEMGEKLQKTYVSLQDERDRAKAIISSMGEGLFVVDNQFKVVLLNAAAERHLEISLQMALGRNIEDIVTVFHKDQKLILADRPVFQAISKKTVVLIELKDRLSYQVSSGRKFSIAMAVTPLRRGDDVVGAVVVFRDITVEKNIDEAKSNFISIASHQLRTPLTAIKLFVEMLAKGQAGRLNEEQKEFVDNVQVSTERMILLVNDLLNVSRIEAGKLQSKIEAVDIVSFLQDIIGEAKSLTAGREGKIEFQKPKEKLSKMLVDTNLFRQVIHNFLTNGIRYSKPKRCDLVVSLTIKGKDLIVSVQDFGIGIPEEVQPRIFEKFYRADNAIKAATDGTGVGMYTAKMIIEELKGKTWFKSKLGEGATFYASLPIQKQ